jgi:ribosomal protein S12 methylthiotransferase accessory factor
MRWIPSRFCYYGYHDQAPGGTPENRFCDADSNGCASGASLEEAIVQGFLELIERDACALWWYNRLLRPKLDLDGLQDPFVERNVAFHHSVGREIYALDLTHDFGIPVFVAISHDDEGGHILMALGAHFDASLALSRALAELNQLAGSFLARHADLVALADNGETIGDDAARWYVTETLESQPYVAPAAGVARPIDAHEAPDFETFAEVLAHCVDLTRERGLELLVLDHTRPGIDFHCARVVVPGLRHFWRRLAPGRLYDVPATLGWTTDRPSEPDLNPISFFL